MSLGEGYAQAEERIRKNHSTVVVALEEGEIIKALVAQGIFKGYEVYQDGARKEASCRLEDSSICEWYMGQAMGQEASSRPQNSEELEVFVRIKKA